MLGFQEAWCATCSGSAPSGNHHEITAYKTTSVRASLTPPPSPGLLHPAAHRHHRTSSNKDSVQAPPRPPKSEALALSPASAYLLSSQVILKSGDERELLCPPPRHKTRTKFPASLILVLQARSRSSLWWLGFLQPASGATSVCLCASWVTPVYSG